MTLNAPHGGSGRLSCSGGGTGTARASLELVTGAGRWSGQAPAMRFSPPVAGPSPSPATGPLSRPILGFPTLNHIELVAFDGLGVLVNIAAERPFRGDSDDLHTPPHQLRVVRARVSEANALSWPREYAGDKVASRALRRSCYSLWDTREWMAFVSHMRDVLREAGLPFPIIPPCYTSGWTGSSRQRPLRRSLGWV
jgi:hypothetical protein